VAEAPKPLRDFGARVRAERQSQNLSQEALGQRSGITSGEISRLERAVREPRLLTIVRIAEALGMSASDLLVGVGKKKR
jgi:transcriptional regulator with XRE-family HTH domain